MITFQSCFLVYIPDADAFLPVFNIMQQLADRLDACGAFGVHASSPAHPAAGTGCEDKALFQGPVNQASQALLCAGPYLTLREKKVC